MCSFNQEKSENPREKEAFTEVKQSLKQYAELQKDVATRMMDATERVKNGEINPNTAYGQTVTRFDMDKMTRGMGDVYEAADEYLEVCGAQNNKDLTAKRAPGAEHKAGEEVRSFARQGMTVSKEEAASLKQNEKEAYEPVKDEVKALREAIKEELKGWNGRYAVPDFYTRLSEMNETYRYTVYFIRLLEEF